MRPSLFQYLTETRNVEPAGARQGKGGHQGERGRREPERMYANVHEQTRHEEQNKEE